MKSLIIPDIHTHFDIAQSIIDSNDFDECILLGDYFDEWYDTADQNKDMAIWLKEYIHKPNHIALIGNHELNYYKDHVVYQCGGYAYSKSKAINKIMKADDWDKLIPYYKCQGYFLTHAGISKQLIGSPFDEEIFIDVCKKEWKRIKNFQSVGKFFEAGYARGGRADCGGIVWCDYNQEFRPIKGLKQIFGHTPAEKYRQYSKTNNYCLDSYKKMKYFCIVTDGKVEIKESK